MSATRVWRLTLWVVLVGAVIAASALILTRDGEDPDDAPVAVVDGVPITRARFETWYIERLIATGRADTPFRRYSELDNLVQIRLLADEARRRGLDAGEEFDAMVRRERLLAAGARYFEREVADELPPLTEQEVRDAYRYSQEKVLLRHLFFRSEEQARHAVELLRQGEDFVDLANEVFDTPTYDSAAGMLGVATYWGLDDAVAEVAFELDPWEISEPVRSLYGWHVLRVEDRLMSPILREDDFQRRRSGIEGRLRIRRNRTAGDRWVRGFMEGLEYRVDTDAAREVVDVLETTMASEDPIPKVQLTPEEIEGVGAALEPETVLVRYTMDGEALTFTAGDFVRWLPLLPFTEVRDRPVAAIGRALRNQALGLKGIRDGLDRAPIALEGVQFATDRWLADRLREQLRAGRAVEPTDDELREAFDRLNAGALEEATADYWVIPAGSYREADSTLQAIRSGRAPSSVPGYAAYAGANIRGSGLGGHLRRVALHTPSVICPADLSCVVASVEARTLVRTTLDEKRDELRELLSTVLPEERLTDSLFGVADVQVDTVLFRQMMELR